MDSHPIDDILTLLLEQLSPTAPEIVIASLYQLSLVKHFNLVIGLRDGCLTLDIYPSACGIKKRETLYESP